MGSGWRWRDLAGGAARRRARDRHADGRGRRRQLDRSDGRAPRRRRPRLREIRGDAQPARCVPPPRRGAGRRGVPGRSADARRRRADAPRHGGRRRGVCDTTAAAARPARGSPPRGLPSAYRRGGGWTAPKGGASRAAAAGGRPGGGDGGLCIHRFVPCQTLQRDASVEWLQLQTDLLGLCAPPVCTDAAQKLPGEIVEWELEEMVDVPPGSVRWARLGELLSSGIPHEAEAALTLIEAQSGARLGQAVVNLATMLDKGHELHGVELPVHAVGATRGGRLSDGSIPLAAVATLDAAAARWRRPAPILPACAASESASAARRQQDRAAGAAPPPVPPPRSAGGQQAEHEAEVPPPRRCAVAAALGAAPPRRVRVHRGSAAARFVDTDADRLRARRTMMSCSSNATRPRRGVVGSSSSSSEGRSSRRRCRRSC